MLQQTQVATVIPYFNRFMDQFDSIHALAAADEQAVLRAWQGLGYYSRARNLLRAARVVVDRHAGRVPETVEALLALPGVGRYTAGAVASLAFDTRAPILDGNVLRVLCRIDLIESGPRDRSTQKILWNRAEKILPDRGAGDFNSALMELGATVCTPRNPQCLLCPVSAHCRALAEGAVDRVPKPKPAKPTPSFERFVFCIEKKGRWLIEQRPPAGRWAGMWQFPTREKRDALGVPVTAMDEIGSIDHALTHRKYRFHIMQLKSPARFMPAGTWVKLTELINYPLPRPHVRVAELLTQRASLRLQPPKAPRRDGIRGSNATA